MNAMTFRSGQWEVECLPDDGARLSLLRFAGQDLLTPAPTRFRAPQRDYGEYELRPVYGYDDCFPSVRSCDMPGRPAAHVRDHGELCWLRWEVVSEANRLDCRVRSEILPAVRFQRSLIFADTSVTWAFEVVNEGREAIPFLHVMHPLMPLDQVVDLGLPRFATRIEEASGQPPVRETPRQCADFLLKRPRGTAVMLLLQNLQEGHATATFDGGMVLEMEFDPAKFPTLGIWWNNAGYPDEEGCRRVECALEPMPGASGSLTESHGEGIHLTVPPEGRQTWQIVWNIRKP